MGKRRERVEAGKTFQSFSVEAFWEIQKVLNCNLNVYIRLPNLKIPPKYQILRKNSFSSIIRLFAIWKITSCKALSINNLNTR